MLQTKKHIGKEIIKKVVIIFLMIGILCQFNLISFASSMSLTWPTPNFQTIVNPFGTRIHPITKSVLFHYGIDIAGEGIHGTDVLAAQSGKVIFSGFTVDEGNVISIDHGNGITTQYKQLQNLGVTIGATVTNGQVIGKVGSTGQYSEGPHLHFEVSENGVRVNPMDYDYSGVDNGYTDVQIIKAFKITVYDKDKNVIKEIKNDYDEENIKFKFDLPRRTEFFKFEFEFFEEYSDKIEELTKNYEYPSFSPNEIVEFKSIGEHFSVFDGRIPVLNITLIRDFKLPIITGVQNNNIYNHDVTITFNEGTATLNGTPMNSGDIVTAENYYEFIVSEESGNIVKVNFMISSSQQKGDIDKDGKITEMDALLALQAASRKVPMTNEQMVIADVNYDGKISALDALKILKFSRGMITNF